jgi:ABC-2 type transport system permease protein
VIKRLEAFISGNQEKRMHFDKFLNIALKDVRQLLQDRATLVITILTPLILTFVIGAAFSGIRSGNSSPIQNIPVIVVNKDSGTSIVTFNLNYGDLFTKALKQRGDLLRVQTLTDEDEARSLVRQGKAAAAIILPASFSAALNPALPGFGKDKISLTVFRDAGSPISADIAGTVARQILNGFTNAAIGVYTLAQTSDNSAAAMINANAIAQDIGAKSATLISVKAKTAENSGAGFDLLQYFAPAMAVLFLNFGMGFGVISILEERENGTLQRLLSSPTTRMTVLAGKLGGTFLNGVIQVTALIVATTVIAPVLGNKSNVWGTNVLALMLLVLVTVGASIGMGTILVAISRNRQQAQVAVSAVMTIVGLVGGAFGTGTQGTISHLTVNYWATSAFSKLAQTNDIVSILPNIGVLVLMFVVFFSIGAVVFSRRLDV